MSDPFIGEIQAFAFNYSDGFMGSARWLPCNGQILQIQQYSPLFALIGTTYGGNGTSTFALPNLNNSLAAMGQGQGPGLTNRPIGQVVGATAVTLQRTEMPAHSHGLQLSAANTPNATQGPGQPATSVLLNPNFNGFVTGAPNTQMASNTVMPNGANEAHPNQQPYLGLWWCIAITGIYPSFP